MINKLSMGQKNLAIKSLAETSLHKINKSINQVFFNETAQMRELRWELAGVDLATSKGAFCDDELVSFSINIPLKKGIFNFLNGTIPEYQHQGLFKTMFESILKEKQKVVLEVLEQKEREISMYEHLGFVKTRKLKYLEGKLSIQQESSSFQYEILPFEEHFEREEMVLSVPSVENSREVLNKRKEFHEIHVLKNADVILSYAIYTPLTMSLREMGAVSEDVLDTLLLRMKLSGENLLIQGLEENSVLINYFEGRGLIHKATMIEMRT